MRIAELGKFYPPHKGGIESYVQQCCRALSFEHEVAAIVFSEDTRMRRELRDGACIVRVPTFFTFASQPISTSIHSEIRRFSPDVIHLHWPNPLAALVCEVLLRDIPVVVTHHCDVTRQKGLRFVTRAIYRKLLERAISVLTLSGRTAEFSQDLGDQRRRAISIPLGVDESILTESPFVEKHMQDLHAKLPGGNFTVGFVGRHVPYKGVDVLIRALALLDHVYAFIAGDGPLRSTWENLSRELGVQHRAIFLGEIDEHAKAALYRSIDALILPSLTTAEAFGIVQAEAQLFGLPVIVSNIPTGVTEITLHEKTGLCVRAGESNALARAIERLAKEPDTRRRFGDAGRERARAVYSSAAVYAALRRHFGQLEDELQARARASKEREKRQLSAGYL